MTEKAFNNAHNLIKVQTAIDVLNSVDDDEVQELLVTLRAKAKKLHWIVEIDEEENEVADVPTNVHVNEFVPPSSNIFSVNWEADEHSK